MVRETYEAGMTVSLFPNQLFHWRKLERVER